MFVTCRIGRQSFASCLLLTICFPVWASAQQKAEEKPDAGIEAKRREVRMLDDLYKGAIVTITEHYVNDKDTIPAGTAFKKLFEAAEAKGWHKVRLLDATGNPYDSENVANDEFEKDAIKQLVAGKPWVESIENRKGTRHLRVLTPIPVVFEKCVMCHDNYADVPKGQAIGALSYLVPIDGPLVSEKAPASIRE
jgi:hypothetical protein